MALAARFDSLLGVVMGTTVGMMLANVPAVLVGEAAAKRLPVKWVHGAAAALFAVVLGWVIDHYIPEAQSLPHAVKLWRGQ